MIGLLRVASAEGSTHLTIAAILGSESVGVDDSVELLGKKEIPPGSDTEGNTKGRR